MSFDTKREGFYTITGPDGALLQKPDGSVRQTTSRDECYERITEDGREGEFRINAPDRVVTMQDAVVAPPDSDPPHAPPPGGYHGYVFGSPNGQASAMVTSPTAHGALMMQPDGYFTYIPDAGYSGSDSFQYTVTDDDGPHSATVNLTVQP